jgi:hypothetical protein
MPYRTLDKKTVSERKQLRERAHQAIDMPTLRHTPTAETLLVLRSGKGFY